MISQLNLSKWGLDLTRALLFTFLLLPLSFNNTLGVISIISGKIVESQPNQLIIQTDSGRQSIFLAPDIKISKNTLQAQLSDLRPNDQVTIRMEDNQPREIITTSAAISEWGRWLPSLIIALLTFTLLSQMVSMRLRHSPRTSDLVTAHQIFRSTKKGGVKR